MTGASRRACPVPVGRLNVRRNRRRGHRARPVPEGSGGARGGVPRRAAAGRGAAGDRPAGGRDAAGDHGTGRLLGPRRVCRLAEPGRQLGDAIGLAMERVVVAPVEGVCVVGLLIGAYVLDRCCPRKDGPTWIPEPVWPPGDRACICIGRDHKGRMTGPHNVGKGKIGNRTCENIPNTEWGRWLEYASCFCK